MKREPGMSQWYCAHGLPRGFEASVFRARGLAPLSPTKTYTRMAALAGYETMLGHDETGALWLWLPSTLARLIPCDAEIRFRVYMCVRLGAMAPTDRETALAELAAAPDETARGRLLIELDTAARLAGYAEQGFTAVLGRCPTVEELGEVWRRIYPLNERGSVYR